MARAKQSTHIIGGGKMGEHIRSFDWAHTTLGPLDKWPQSLITTVNLLLQTPVPIVLLWGSDGIMLYNDGYAIFAGARHPRLLGSKVVEGWPEVADFNRNVMVQGLAGKTLSYKDQQLTLYRHGVAEEVWMDLNYSPVIGESGEPEGVWAFVIETTKRVSAEASQRQAEEALKMERGRLRSLFEQAPALIAVLRGPTHVFELANKMYLRTVSSGREILGLPIMEALPELEGQGIVEILDEVLRTGKPYSGELRAKLDSNDSGELKEHYFNLVYQPIVDVPGTPPHGIFVHAVDITDQVRSRQKAEQLHAQLEAVFDSLPDGLYIADTERIVRINQRGAEVLGFDSPDDMPRDLNELYAHLIVHHGNNTKPSGVESSTLSNALRGISVQHVGMRVYNTKTKRHQVLRTAGAPIRDHDGNVIGGVAINNDLTEVYALQEKVQKEAVQRRLLMQRAKLLKEQNEQLTSLNAAKDEFIALTSHQLRTPATGVKQYVAMLMQGYAGEPTEAQLQFLQQAYDSNERQLEIIDDILRVAKVDMGQVEIVKRSHDFAGLIKDILGEQSDHFRGRNLKLVTDFPNQSVMVTVDARQLHMAIGNIVDNAIKYSPDYKRITVRLTSPGQDLVQLEISDQGVGIAPEDIDKLFQKFSRIPNPRSVSVGGTGLGLYWAKCIIELHGGTVEVISSVGEGTSFIIKLPVPSAA